MKTSFLKPLLVGAVLSFCAGSAMAQMQVSASVQVSTPNTRAQIAQLVNSIVTNPYVANLLAALYPPTGGSAALKDALNSVTCKSETLKGVPFSWCIKNSALEDKSKVIYYLHGANANARSFIDSTQYYGKLQSYWIANRQTRPVVISVSFGPAWTLTEVPSATVVTNPLLMAFFTDEVMKYLEAKVGGSGIKKRFIVGDDMGGYNAARLLTRKGSLFQKVVLGCPSLFSISPFSRPIFVSDYIERTGAFPELVQFGFDVLGADFRPLGISANNAWFMHNPIGLANNLTSTSPEVLFWYNLQDKYGFFEGSMNLRNL